jgi:hypothetical protein
LPSSDRWVLKALNARSLPSWLGSGASPVAGNSLAARIFSSDWKIGFNAASFAISSPRESMMGGSAFGCRVKGISGSGASSGSGGTIVSSMLRSRIFGLAKSIRCTCPPSRSAMMRIANKCNRIETAMPSETWRRAGMPEISGILPEISAANFCSVCKGGVMQSAAGLQPRSFGR